MKSKKHVTRIRLAIGVPTTGAVRIEWTESLLAMQRALFADVNLKIDDIKLFYHCSSVIPKNRQQIIEVAKVWGATHILWIDDDMRFPPIAAKALIYGMRQHPEIMILGANCIKRKFPIEYMGSYHDDTEVVSEGKKGIEQVRYTGNSFILMNMEVFNVLPKPWFAFAWHKESEDFGTEDVFFMYKAAEAGIPTYVDHEVSQLIDHIGVYTFKPQYRIDGRRYPDLPDWLVSRSVVRGVHDEGEDGTGTSLDSDGLGRDEGGGIFDPGQCVELQAPDCQDGPVQGAEAEQKA